MGGWTSKNNRALLYIILLGVTVFDRQDQRFAGLGPIQMDRRKATQEESSFYSVDRPLLKNGHDSSPDRTVWALKDGVKPSIYKRCSRWKIRQSSLTEQLCC